MSQILLTGKSYRNFIEAIHSPFSKVNYKNSLLLFMNWKKVDGCDVLISEDPKTIQESIIDYILYMREERKIASTSISTNVAAIRKFYDCNDIELKWKKIKNYVGRNKTKRNNGKKDRPYTSMEILKMLEKADERGRAIILLMASSGIRVGALPSLKIRNIEKIEKYGLYKITVYENEDEEYITYCTPECAKAIDSYLEYRQRHGERPLKENAPLIREEFDIHDEIRASRPRILEQQTFKKLIRNIGLRSIQDQFVLTPLSAFQSGQALTNSTSNLQGAGSNVSQGLPPAPDPALIPPTGIKIYDEISKDMADNPPPLNDSGVIAKFETIGIGPGMTPSKQTNETIRQALENGIAEGEKIINARLRVLGADVNGWDIMGMVVNGSNITNDVGNFGTDYLLRAAVAKFGLFANSPVEALYPGTFTDSQGQNLTGANKYVIHFEKGQTPPVNAFWSLTMYNNASYLVDNPINRYTIGDRTPGLKYNEDGSLDIYIQHDNPGPDKESNWLPAPAGDFNLTMRLYNPQDSVLNGEYQYPPVQRVT